MSNLAVKTIDHVTLVVKDLQVSQKFYVDFLGMHIVPRPNFSFEGLWFQAGMTLIHLIKEHDQSGPAGWCVAENSAKGRTHHIAFLVENGEQAYQLTIEQYIPICTPPKLRPDGAYQFFVYDPDGHIIELCSDPQ